MSASALLCVGVLRVAVALPTALEASSAATAGGAVAPGDLPTTSVLAAAQDPTRTAMGGVDEAELGAEGANAPLERDCESKGAAHQIVIPRASEWVHPNSSFRLLPSVVDAKGCPVARGPFTYTIDPKTRAMTVGRNSGVVKVANDAPEGAYDIVVRSGALSATTTVSVVNRDKLASLLEQPASNLAIQETPRDVGATVREVWGTAPAEAADLATPRKWWFVGLTGLVTLGLGLLGLRLLRAGSRPTPEPPPAKPAVGGVAPTIRSATTPPNSATVPSSAVPPNVATPSSTSVISSSSVISNQGLSNPPPKPTPVADVGERGRLMPMGLRCPRCGVLYTDGSLFCGTDGAKLLRAGENSSNEKFA